MKSNYIVRASKFMRDFFPYMRKCGNIEEAVRVFNETKHRAVKFAKGATRYVLITSDYVVKWDYKGGMASAFGGCREEYTVYEKVKNSGYGYLFAPITPIEVRGRTFYIMPRVRELAVDSGRYYYPEEILSEDETDYLYDVVGLQDLHDENWGFVDGQVTLIDYACVGC